MSRPLLLGGIVAAVALRVWVLASPIGALDADEAVWGLMARHFQDGELATFFWGQNYGGTQEALLTALVFFVTGTGTLALRIVPIALFVLAAVLVWRVGRRTVGEDAARLGAVLFLVWPSYVVWKSTRAHGFYGAALVLALVVVLLALRLRERDAPLDMAALGLALGLGWWATPQFAFVAVPALAWLVWRRPSVLRRAWLALPTLLAGAAPWLVWSLRHDWETLTNASYGGGSYFDHLRTFLYATLPAALGIRVPFTLEWLPGPVLGRLLELVALASFAYCLVRRRGRRELLLAVGALYPFIQSFSPFGSLNEEPRYLVLLAPVTALLLAEPLARRGWTAGAGLAVAIALSVAGLAAMGSGELAVAPVGGKRVPADLGPALRALERLHVTRARAVYAIAYRIDFESRERIIAGSTGQVRYRPYEREVRSVRWPAYVFVAGSDDEHLSAPDLAREGYRWLRAGDWSIYVRGRGP
jgi:hypothetical protein